jgi:RNA polymerase sigma factor (sigma-70 family)
VRPLRPGSPRLSACQCADVERVIPAVRGVVAGTYRSGLRFTAFTREDVFQAAMEGVCRARRRWDPERGPWLTYARIRAKGAALDFLRQQRPGTRRDPARNPLSLDGADPVDMIGYRDPEPRDLLFERQLWDAVDRLPAKTAAAFRLYAEGDLTQADVARRTGVSEEMVSLRLKAARARLAPTAQRLLDAVIP